MAYSVKRWLETFFEEKDLPIVTWEIEDGEGMTHFFSSDLVQDLIINHCSTEEQKEIRDKLVYLDFYNADINDFLKHLATGYIRSVYA